MAVSASSCGACLLALFLFSPLLASVKPALANRTSIQPFSAADDHRSHSVVSTMVTAKQGSVPAAVDLFHQSPTTQPWSRANVSSWALPKYKGGGAIVGHLLVTKTSGISHADRDRESSAAGSPASPSAASVASNGSGTEHAPLRQQQELPGVAYRRHRRRNGSSPAKPPKAPRKPLCSYHRTASLLHDRVECSGVLVVVVSGSALLVSICSLVVAGFLLRCVHRKRTRDITGAVAADLEDDDRDPDRTSPRPGLHRRAPGPRRFSYDTLAAATSNFAECKRIGRGGFGSVYRGYLKDQDRHVAVKTFSGAGSPEQGRREFEAEVEVLSQLRHRNVVQLVGWCDGQKGLFIVCELVRGGSLDKYLHHPDAYVLAREVQHCAGPGRCHPLSAHGVRPVRRARRYQARQRDARLVGQRQARRLRLGEAGRSPSRATDNTGRGGNPGLHRPRVRDGKRSTESDVYSFGVVLLEIATGERPTAAGQPQPEASDSKLLLNRVRCMRDRNSILDAADGRLGGAFDVRQMERVLVTGLWCVDRDRSGRPSIAQAMEILRSDNSELPLALPRECGEIRVVDERVYGDLLTTEDDVDGSTISSATSTAYLSLEDMEHLSVEQ